MEILSRILNLLAIAFLIYGFCLDCFFLYVGTFLVIFSETTLWYCMYKLLKQKPKAREMNYKW